MTLLSQTLNPTRKTDGGEVLEMSYKMTIFRGFKVEILQIYHRNPRISQYTIGNPHKY